MSKPNQRKGRRASNLSIDGAIMEQARALNLNVSRAAEAGIAQAIADERARLWQIENREAIDMWNDYLDTNGLPLDRYRQF